jgi:hypothetical protein
VTRAGDDKPFAGLRSLAGCGGCAAKAPQELVALLASVAAAASGKDAAVLAGLAPADDAAVYALDSTRALVATVDFFPPLVDDPTDYGTIAAANAVSDIYAMGGSVAFALVVSGFPGAVPTSVIAEVNRAAAAVVANCGGSVLGGHSIHCAEPVFGLCVLGFVHPERVCVAKSGGAAWRCADAVETARYGHFAVVASDRIGGDGRKCDENDKFSCGQVAPRVIRATARCHRRLGLRVAGSYARNSGSIRGHTSDRCCACTSVAGCTHGCRSGCSHVSASSRRCIRNHRDHRNTCDGGSVAGSANVWRTVSVGVTDSGTSVSGGWVCCDRTCVSWASESHRTLDRNARGGFANHERVKRLLSFLSCN